MRHHQWTSFTVLASLLAGCSAHYEEEVAQPLTARAVSVEVEVYDPVTGFVWEDVGVRVVEADMEWSGVVKSNRDPNAWRYTDRFGIVYFDAADLAFAEVGFEEDGFGIAVLDPDFAADEAFVQVEIAAPGFRSTIADVPLSWEQPDGFISIPFTPIGGAIAQP